MALAVVVLLSLAARADPEGSDPSVPTVTRVVFRRVAGDSAAPGRWTLYRQGEGRGRLEFPAEGQASGRILIVDEPSYWIVESGQVRHSVDPGPTYRFRAPVVSRTASDTTLPGGLGTLEIGLELNFLEANAATTTATGEPASGVRREVTRGDVRVVMSATKEGRPQRLEVWRADVLLDAVEYDAYETGLAAQPALFAPPAGLPVVETVTRPAEPPAP
jgi:hypothetical protein